MNGVLFAKSAILFKFDTIGIVLLVFHIVVIALLTFGASQSNFISHNRPPVFFAYLKRHPFESGAIKIYHFYKGMSSILMPINRFLRVFICFFAL